MNISLKSKTLSLVITLFVLTVNGQEQNYLIKKYDSDALPRVIRCTYQDSKGFLWIGSKRGLFKYDGINYKSFYSNIKDTIGLRDSNIFSITEDSKNQIWIGTSKGLHKLKNDSIFNVPFRIKNYSSKKESISRILEYDNKVFLGSAEGLHYVNNKEQVMPASKIFNEKTLDDLHIFGLTKDYENNLWISGKNQVFRYSNKDEKLTKISISFDEVLSKEDFYFYQIIAYKDYFLVDSERGLLKGTFKNNNLHLEIFYTQDKKIAPFYTIYDTKIDTNDYIWLGTYRNNIKKFQIVNDSIREISLLFEPEIPMPRHVISVSKDQQNNIWFGTTNGLLKLSKNTQAAQQVLLKTKDCENTKAITAITREQQNYTWLSNGNDLFRIPNKKLSKKICYDSYKVDLPNKRKINRLFVDSNNRIWVSTHSGIYIARITSNMKSNDWVNYSIENGLPHNFTYEVLEETPNKFWLGTYKGLVKLSLKDNLLSRPSFKIFNYKINDSLSLVNDWALELCKDGQNNLWIGTYSGLSKLSLNEKEPKFINYNTSFKAFNTISNENIKDIFLDADDRLWIGTQEGLNLYRKNTNDFFRIGLIDGLPSTYIMGIKQDKKGVFWIATSKGLFKGIWNDDKNTFTEIEIFSESEGLYGNTIFRGALLVTENHAFTGIENGLGRIEIDSQTNQEIPFNLEVTTLKSTKNNLSGFHSISTKNNNSFVKPYNENSIQLAYAALDLSNVSYNNYRHQLEPVHEDWINTGKNSSLTFYNLPPDDYVLKLDGTNHLGQWSKSPIEINFTIKAPFWKTNLAYLFYSVLGVLCIWLPFKLKLQKEIRKVKQELAISSAKAEARHKLRKESTADFHDELGSKLTKISMFLTLAERAFKEKRNPEKWLGKIRANTRELSSNFRDLLWVNDPNQDTLYQLFLRLSDFGADLFEDTKVNFQVSGYDKNMETFQLDASIKKQVVFIFKEAMNNILKYAKAERVDLHFSLYPKDFSIEITDNGVGFSTTTKTSGRGLLNMKIRAEKIKSKLTISSSENGTTISMQKITHLGDSTTHNTN